MDEFYIYNVERVSLGNFIRYDFMYVKFKNIGEKVITKSKIFDSIFML